MKKLNSPRYPATMTSVQRRLAPIRKAHLDAARAESDRRKAAGEPRKFAQDVLDDWIAAGRPVPVHVNLDGKQTTTKGK